MTIRSSFGPAMVTALSSVAALLVAWLLTRADMSSAGGGYDIGHMVLLYSTLPRMATALICGAALALSGALFQQVLRNPLASPTTLGISSGANLALVLAMLYMPGLLGFGRDLVALVGSAVAAGLVFLLGARRGFSPFALVMAGLVISLWCGALAAVLTLLNERYLVSLFIWGSGSLSQQSWVIPLSLLPKVGVIALLAALLVRPLTLIELGEAGATALGLRIGTLRFAAVLLAVALAAFVTSAVGVIGFIGLVAPTIARLSGARRPVEILVWSTLIGASLLFLTDVSVMYLAGAMSDFLPTGAVTAVFGSPLLLLLLPRLKSRHRPAESGVRQAQRRSRPRTIIVVAAAMTLLIAGAALVVGRLPGGDWALLSHDLFSTLGGLRLPRIAAAFLAGVMLAVAGVILQRLTGNEMASPEVLGIGAGATLGVAAGLFVVMEPSVGLQLALASAGALTVLAAIFLITLRSGLAPERVLLGGIALSAMVDAIVGVLGATGDPRAMFLLRWMSGSTYAVEVPTVWVVTLCAVLLLTAALVFHRWLDLLPLGPAAASSLGVSLPTARLTLLAIAGLLSAAGTLCVGPLSFIGLMAPHAAREIGLKGARATTAGAAIIGGGLMVLADWAGRTIVFPYEIPAGLVSALIGAPFLILLIRRRG
ncbi:Fe(3+)-hydroxamate ABC transporter permease FhuB [Rhizobium sp. NRK18]|uniref:Fe(3+)-hydroxamate ABC transporter permease FhuB n=1 Tax=Rhizobium sp. NRK18 TaxID=2964667 RepID=UPI0021C36C25|nr:Fe(3+)-hydroxamate ABC transporter permease FhuB [Rhizobium sp. NRK18]MCQ2006153.1 Fe(3+)-hydroxamate ABC transporter permease FhuB [Rhizobium sp. NRK18]